MEERHAKGDLKKLNPAEIKALKEAGINPEVLKGEKRTGKRDLYKDKDGTIRVFAKGEKGPGESTGLNIKDIM
jgi:hypothetical protein